MKKTLRVFKRTLVAVIGVIVTLIGVILIPLPGPGLLIVLAGLLILSIEFEWARRHRDSIKRHVESTMQKAREKHK